MDRIRLKRHARELRANQTPHELLLWRQLRLRQVHGVRFLRQYAVAGFILDFYAPTIRLAIEVDGGQHFEPAATRHDEVRALRIADFAIDVLRYTNLEVAREMDAVLRDIERAVGSRLGHPPAPAARPPSSGRG